jgi:hypothetical protein
MDGVTLSFVWRMNEDEEIEYMATFSQIGRGKRPSAAMEEGGARGCRRREKASPCRRVFLLDLRWGETRCYKKDECARRHRGGDMEAAVLAS